MQKNIETIVEQALGEPQTTPYILALSGGIDSMTLFHVLLNTKKAFVAVHINHKKRFESDNEYAQLKALCKTHNIPFEGAVFENDSTGNFQKNARLFRQRFLKEIAIKYQSNTILTAHHYDDLLETFLMRVLEGRSLSGLSPMKKILNTRDGFTFIKPFFDIEKSQIIKYANDREISYFSDSSNTSNVYTRNRIRHRIMPLLEEENPNFKSNIKTTLDDLDDLNGFLDAQVETHPMFQHHKMNASTFSTFNPAMKRRFLKRKLETYIPSLYPSKKYLDDIISQLESNKNLKIVLNDDVCLHKEYGEFFIAENKGKPSIHVIIEGPGDYAIDESHTLIVTDKKKTAILTKPYVLWYNNDVYPLIMRTRENGDTVRFTYGHKKINRLFIDRKIAPHKRDEVLLLTDDSKNVLWIPYMNIKQQSSKGRHCLYFYLITDSHRPH